MGGASGSEHRVVSAVVRRGHLVLLCHRHPGRVWYPDCWDLPGGHLEPGESPREALLRELREELGIEAEVPATPLAQMDGPDLVNDIWVVDAWVGEPTNRAPAEHDEIAWFARDQVSGLQLADTQLEGLLARLRR